MTTTHGIELRTAHRDDLAALEQLIERSVRELGAAYYTSQQIESSLRHVFGVDTRLVDHGCYFIAQSDSTIVAAGGWSRWRTLYGGDQFKDDEDPLLDPARDAARIRAFFVHPDWTRRGLARMLFDRCVREARTFDFHALELMATLPGEPLYRALGFVTDERVAIALPDGVTLPLVRMSRAIDE
jgi:GNAT superfamily N-acetyltransferase